MNKIMTAKYNGTCGDCRLPIVAGTQINYGGRGAITHGACKPLATARRSTGTRSYSRPRGRCEDAPCCGCCDNYGNPI